MGLFSSFFDRNGAAASRAVQSEGFRLAAPEQLLGELAPAQAQAVAARASKDGLLGWAAQAEQRLGEELRLPDSTPFATLAARWPSGGQEVSSEGARRALVKPFVDAHAEHPTPFVATMLAAACLEVAEQAKPPGVVGVGELGERLHAFWSEKARETLAGHPGVEGSLPFADLRYRILAPRPDVSLDQRHYLLMEALELDPINLPLMREHARYLVPAAVGEGSGDLAGFASWVADKTEPLLGQGAYAYVMGLGPSSPGLNVQNSGADAERIAQGFKDLLERYPSIRVGNEYAATLCWAGDRPGTAAVFDAGLRLVDPAVWSPYMPSKAVEAVGRVYVWSRG